MPQDLAQASASYKQHRDHASLERIFRHLRPQMQQKDVERLLGRPDYSPTAGIFYYSSDRDTDRAGDGTARTKVTLGVVVDYTDPSGTLTDRLQEFWMGPIGE